MIKSLSVSSEGSLPPLEDDIDSVCSDELLGSQSRRWLSDLLTSDMSLERAEDISVGSDGLFVDRHFPVGELEMQPVKWKRPKVTKKEYLQVDFLFQLAEYDCKYGDLAQYQSVRWHNISAALISDWFSFHPTLG